MRPRSSRRPLTWVIGAVVLVWLAASVLGEQPDEASATDEVAATTAPTATEPTTGTTDASPDAEEPDVVEPVLLTVTDLKDGDSFDASDGREYRLGMVNTPERGERCAKEATAFTREFLADGFRVEAYSGDDYGRVVAEVRDPDGRSLNIALARNGLGDDRYLAQFRDENPVLARRLDSAFAGAKTPSCAASAPRGDSAPRGFVAEPAPADAPAQGVGDCAAGYSPCLPVVADLDCGEIGHPVSVTGADQYRLDRDRDGTGCD